MYLYSEEMNFNLINNFLKYELLEQNGGLNIANEESINNLYYEIDDSEFCVTLEMD